MKPRHDLPDYRNIERGLAWLKSMIAESEKLDAGKRGTIRAVPPLATGRTPGEDDE